MAVEQRRAAAPETRLATFERLAALETDDCVIWPHKHETRPGHGDYGRFAVRPRGVVWCHAEALKRREEPPSPSHQAAHSCRTPRCMNYRHLRWATAAENNADKFIHGTVLKGVNHPNHKLTEAQVVEMRHLYATGQWAQWQLGDHFGVSQVAVSKTVRKIYYPEVS